MELRSRDRKKGRERLDVISAEETKKRTMEWKETEGNAMNFHYCFVLYTI